MIKKDTSIYDAYKAHQLEIVADMKAMLDGADSRGEDLTPNEQADYSHLETQLADISKLVEECETIHSVRNRPSPQHGSVRTSRHSGDFMTVDGQRIRTIGYGEPMADSTKARPSTASFGEMAAGLVTEKWDGRLDSHAALQLGSPTRGGITVGTEISREITDFARSKSVVMRAGVRSMEFPAGAAEFRLVRQTSDPTGYWRQETASITASEPLFTAHMMRPRTLGVLIPLTIETIEDSLNLGAAVERATAGAIGAEIDRVVLQGTGAGAEPQGIANLSGVTESDFSSASVTYDLLIDAQDALWDQNAPEKSQAIVLSPANEQIRQKLKAGDGHYLMPPVQTFGDVPFMVTSNAPNDMIFLGEWSTVVVAFRSQMKLEYLGVGTATDAQSISRNALTDLMVWLRAHVRLDVGFTQPSWVCRAINVTQ